MKNGVLASVLAALAAVAAPAFAADQKNGGEPFYRKYLVVGNPLDDRILEEERRVNAEPDSADRRNDFGNLLAERRFVEDARNQYERALELDKSHFLAAYNLGLLWETEGRPMKAISAYRKSISRKPGFPQSHFRLGRLYEKRGWERLAVKEYAKAMRLDPQMRDPRTNPLVIDSRLIDRASLENYPRDIAVASMGSDQQFADSWRFRSAPIDRPLSTEDIEDRSAPEPVDSTVSPSSGAPVGLPLSPGQTRPQQALPPGAPPPPPEPPPEPE
jgi:tetratricopeptide (TPR) repeat protein